MGLRIGRKLNLLMAGVSLLAIAAGGYLVSEPGRDATPPLAPAAAMGLASPEHPAAIPEPVAAPSTPPAAGAIETEPFDARRNLENELGTLIDPDFGPLVERGEARVEIAVVDALGQPLDPMGWKSDTHTRVWRQEGAGWQKASVKWDIGHLVAGGGPGAGLEPGDHEAALSLGSYGVGRINFRVGRGEHGRLALRMPGWRRVVTLRFVDPEGRPIPYLGAPPRFSAAASAPLPDRPKAPGVLRDPPHRNTWIGFGGGGCSSFRSCRRRGMVCYPTDEGRYSVPVIAGVAGQIRIYVDQRLFLNKIAQPLRSDFSGPEWGDYIIRLEPRPDYAETVAAWRKIHPDDPGRRRQAHGQPSSRRRIPSPTHRDPFDLGTLSSSRFRLLVNLDVPRGVHPVICKGDAIKQILHPRAADSLVHADLKPESGLQVIATDGAFYWGDGHHVKKPRKKELIRLTLEEAPLPCSFEVRSTPTLAAWARSVSFALTGAATSRESSASVRRKARPARRDGEWHGYETFLSDTQRQTLEHAATLHLGYGRKAGSTLGYDAKGGVDLSGDVKYFIVPLTRGQRDALLNGRLALDLTQELARTQNRPVIAFRCVGDRDEGVPWVEASIVPAEEDALARAMRHASCRLADRSLRPDAAQLVAAARAPASPSVEEPEEEIEEETETPVIEEIDDEEIVEFSFVEIEGVAADEIPPMPGLDLLEPTLGAETIAAYGEAGLRRLWAQGAWYDTHRKLKSDADGYVISEGQRLVPGRAYVLYLWSHSRDDLHPDRRVVFEATPGITDLGILRLPSH